MPKRKHRKRNKVADYLMYIGLRLFAMFVHMFPMRTNYRTARWLGDLMYALDHRHRNRAVEHLRRSFPDWSEEQLRRVAKRSMRNLLYLGVEMLFTTRLVTPAKWAQHIRFAEMADNIRLMVERKTAMISITGHFGNWEVIGYVMAALGMPTVSVARNLDNPFVNRYVLGVREKKGQRILDKNGATREADAILQARGNLCFIADQDAGRKGMFVDFFGRKASTYKSIALLAIQYNIPVVVGYGRRLDETYHFEIGINRLIRPEEWADKDDPVRWITQEYTSALEAVIRQSPEQYLWVHRRWKHRPRGEEPGPDGIA